MKPSNKVAKYQSGNVILKQTEELGPLVLGDCNSAMDKKIHKEFNIQTVISIGQQAMPIKEKLPQNCKHFFYDIHDNKSQKVPTQLFDQVSKIIEQGRKAAGVLVHCYAGVSRSSTFVIAYIIQKFNKSYDASKQEVKNSRSCIYPNDGFVHHLRTYEKVIQKREEQRLRKIQEQKRLLIENSLVKSARKSVRGGVKSADMSPEKVKQMAESRRYVHEIIIDPIEVIKEQKQQSNDLNVQKTKDNNSSPVKRIDKSQLQEHRINSKSVFLMSKQKMNSQRKNQEFKLPKVNGKIQTQTKKQVKQGIKKKEKMQKIILPESQKTQRVYKSNIHLEKTTKIQVLKQTKKQQATKQQPKSTMRQSKSVISTKKQKSIAPQIQESLLNEHQKKVKKIYETKIIVK